MGRFNLDIIEKVTNISYQETAYEALNAIFSVVIRLHGCFAKFSCDFAGRLMYQHRARLCI